MFRSSVREFAEGEIRPRVEQMDEHAKLDPAVIQQCFQLGLMGIEVAEDYDGSGLDPISYVLAMEEVSAACASTGVIMSVNNSLVCDPLSKFANEAQKQRWLRPLARGEKLGCFQLSEPNAGSDAAAQ